jgi:hypothetical protein
MSLSRIAMRAAVMEALVPHGTPDEGPWPTLARQLVYDSSYAPVDDLSEDERRPVVQVYTDETESTPRQPSGGSGYNTTIDLRFEISIPQLVRSPGSQDGEEGEAFIYQPETDEMTEASLDLLETQILFALHRGATGKLFRDTFGIRFTRIHSEPLRSAEERVRIGMRTITLRVSNVKGDCFEAIPTPDADGLDLLPEPYRSVAKALPSGSPGLAIAQQIARGMPVSPAVVPLAGITLTYNVAASDGTVDGNADLTTDIPLQE